MRGGAFLKVKEGRVGFRPVTHSVFTFASKFLKIRIMETKDYYLKCIFMINKTEDPDFVASWQKVEEALKRLNENQVERLFSKKHASLADFHQALIKELELKAADLESAVASLKEESKAIMQETLEIKSETKKLREERERMSEELLQKKHELDLLKTTPYPHKESKIE